MSKTLMKMLSINSSAGIMTILPKAKPSKTFERIVRKGNLPGTILGLMNERIFWEFNFRTLEPCPKDKRKGLINQERLSINYSGSEWFSGYIFQNKKSFGLKVE